MPRRHHRRSVDGAASAPHNDASPSPSQRYQTFRRNQERRKSVAEQFARTLPFELDEFQRQANEALEARELIKGRVLESAMLTPREACQTLARLTRSEPVQVIGTKFVLYRESHSKEKKDKIVLVKDRKKPNPN